IVSSTTATTVTFLGTITPVAGRTDIAGLDYDRENQVLYAVFDDSNYLRAMQPDGTFVGEWVLPGNSQEGIAIHGSDLFVAEDSGKIWRYQLSSIMQNVGNCSNTAVTNCTTNPQCDDGDVCTTDTCNSSN